MIDSFYLAARYLIHHLGRSLLVVASLVLVAGLPISLDRILSESERQLTARADATPMLIGSKGSALDLVMGAVYFGGQAPEPISLAEIEAIEASGLAYGIPVHAGFTARGAPIVGTSVDYFEFRGLAIAEGKSLATLGECVIGAGVAGRLEIGPGDTLVSAPESPFDLAGVYPLKMRVAGVLSPSGSADDLAVFVDVKTAWVIQGLGHGHQDLTAVDDPSLVVSRDDGRVVASAKVVEYQEITPANQDSFHFHGESSTYPLTAALLVPEDERAGTLLLGRYVAGDQGFQIVRPRAIIGDLLATIFRVKEILDGAVAIVSVAAVLALALVFSLSFRLRERELSTNFELGASRSTTARLLTAELILLAGSSALIVGIALWLLDRYAPAIVRTLLIG